MEQRRQLKVSDLKYQRNGIKVLVIGQDHVGKTTLIRALCEITNYFLKNKQYSGYLKALPEMKYLEANLADMQNLLPITIAMCDVFILVYAVDDLKSFKYIKKVAEEIEKAKGDMAPLVVVANKIDLQKHEVDHIMADRIVTTGLDSEHLMTIATERSGVRTLFTLLLGFFGPQAAAIDQSVGTSPSTFRRFLCGIFCP